MATTQTFICREVPVGAINGTNTTFQLGNIPNPNTEQVFLNGLLQRPGAQFDYTISENTITFNDPLEDGENVLVSYFYDVISSSEAPPQFTEGADNARTNLIHWCLRKLGAPVVEINIDDDQIDDRINEALYYFRDYHFDGVERIYLSHQITASHFLLAQPFTGELIKNDILQGETSGATAWVYDITADGKKIRFKTQSGTFEPGETLKNLRTNDTCNIAGTSEAIFIGDVDNHYIPVGQKVISITNILPQSKATIGGNMGGMFDFQYQFALHNMFNLASTDLVTYDIYQRYMSTWEFMFRGQKGIRFNRKTDRVNIDLLDWVVDQWIVLEAWAALDPNQYTEIYMDEFVREYACSLLKQQWGTNLKKYTGIQLPGGTLLNGQQIYEEATQELKDLRERIKKEFELPPDFMVG